MAKERYDVVGIGNAIVDIISRCDDGFLSKHDLAKGFMRLIDAEEANRLYAAMGPAVERSGGSVANTIAGLASFGANAASSAGWPQISSAASSATTSVHRAWPTTRRRRPTAHRPRVASYW